MPLVLEAWLAVKEPDLECVYFSCATRWEDLWYEARLPPLPPCQTTISCPVGDGQCKSRAQCRQVSRRTSL